MNKQKTLSTELRIPHTKIGRIYISGINKFLLRDSDPYNTIYYID